MFKRLFGPEKKEDATYTGPPEEPTPPTPQPPSTPPPHPPEPPVEVDPEGLEEVLSQIIGFLNDVGLSDDDIVEAAKAVGGRNPVPEYGSPGGYLVSAYGNMFREDLSAIHDNMHSMIHDLMAYSRLGMGVEWGPFDEELLEGYIRPALSSFGVDIELSEHDIEESYQITVRKGSLEKIADVDQSSGPMDLDESMVIIRNLIVDFGLIYLDIDNTHGEACQYFLFEKEHLASVREKYGDFFDEVVYRPK